MFADMISRDGGEPWGPTGMSTARWLRLPVLDVPLGDLIATQPGLRIASLIGARPSSHCGDPVCHVIAWRGRLYCEDGHHRAVRAALSGHVSLPARVLRVAS